VHLRHLNSSQRFGNCYSAAFIHKRFPHLIRTVASTFHIKQLPFSLNGGGSSELFRTNFIHDLLLLSAASIQEARHL